MTALVPPRQEPLTLKQALEIYGASELQRRKDEFILIRVAHSRHSSKYLRGIIPDIWGQTFLFRTPKSAKEFLLSLEDVVRERISRTDGSSSSRNWSRMGSAVTAIRFLVNFLIEEHDLA